MTWVTRIAIRILRTSGVPERSAGTATENMVVAAMMVMVSTRKTAATAQPGDVACCFFAFQASPCRLSSDAYLKQRADVQGQVPVF